MDNADKLALAREWAGMIDRLGNHADTLQVAAADVIRDLPDEWVDAAKLREVIETTPIDPGSLVLDPLIEELRALLPTHYPAHECAADVLYSVIHEGAVRTAWRVDNDDTPWIVGVGHSLGSKWAADKAVRVLGPAVPADGVVDCPVVSDDADDLTDLREARADDNGARVTLEQVAEADPACIYTDSDGDEWEYIDGRWVNGDTPDERVAKRRFRFGRDNLPEEYGPYRKARLSPESAEQDDVPDFDPAYTYRDKDGDVWSYRKPYWSMDFGFSPCSIPPAEYGPYTRVDKEADR